MTTKRYYMEYDGNFYKCIVDCEKKVLYTDRKQIVDLLNEQHETIQQQKEAIGHLSYDCEYLKNNFEDKCKENEELKQQVELVNTACGKYNIDFECLEECLDDFDNFLDDEYNGGLGGYTKDEKELIEKEKDKSCGWCKHFQLDGMFGIWCDKNHDWKNVENGSCGDCER